MLLIETYDGPSTRRPDARNARAADWLIAGMFGGLVVFTAIASFSPEARSSTRPPPERVAPPVLTAGEVDPSVPSAARALAHRLREPAAPTPQAF